MSKRREAQSYLLDQHIEVLGYLWSEACYSKITPSVKDQAEAKLYCIRRNSGAEAPSHGMYRTVRLEDPKNFVPYSTTLVDRYTTQSTLHNGLTSHDLDLSNAVRVPKDHTDLRRCCALLCELANLIHYLFGGSLEPCWWCSRVRNSGGRYTLAVAVKATHDGEDVVDVMELGRSS